MNDRQPTQTTLHIQIHDEAERFLREQEKRAGTVTEVVRRALALYKLVLETQEAGGEVVIRQPRTEQKLVVE